MNYFFDILPNDIKNYIYKIRLNNQLSKIYYTNVARKSAIAILTLNMKWKTLPDWHYEYFNNVLINGLSRDQYYDTKEIKTYQLLKRVYMHISINDDITWWKHQVINPIELSLIYYKWFPAANDQLLKNNDLYYKCYDLYFDLLEKLNIPQSADFRHYKTIFYSTE